MIGYISLQLSFFTALLTIILFVFALGKNQQFMVKLGKGTILLGNVFITIASLRLFYLLINHDFQTLYVAFHTSNNMPLIYAISAFWAGQEGSLLLWAWVLSLFMGFTLFSDKKDDELSSYKSLTLALVLLFFLFMLLYVANPFERLGYLPNDGSGLNPLLMSLGMVFHPPALLIGYAGFTIPFAYAIGGFLTSNNDWIIRCRKWSLISWLFLTTGIFLGGWWAYHVLGWGGYWAWDPVENVSLLPWLLGTAFLHSIIVQERRGGLKGWNFFLMIFTFILVILATFLTRSGILSSVHSFAASPLGSYFLIFIFLILSGSMIIYIRNYKFQSEKKIFETFISKEVSFLFNNMIFLVLTIVILLGTIFPLIAQVILGYQVTIGSKYYSDVTLPLALILFFLMGICPLISWRRAHLPALKRRFIYPILAVVMTLIISFLFGIYDLISLLTVSVSTFVISTHGLEFWRGIKSEKKIRGSGYITSFLIIFKNNRRRYGGYLVHISIVILLIGVIASSFYNTSKMVSLNKGEAYNLNEYTLIFDDHTFRQETEKSVFTFSLNLLKNGEIVHTASPSIEYYSKQKQYLTQVYIYTAGFSDLYIIPVELEENVGTFKIESLPLVNLIWIGATMMCFSTIIAMTASNGIRKDKTEVKRVGEVEKY